MADRTNRIFFKDNPYPNGHKIIEFIWSGRLEPETGLWFDFHLKTEEYYAEDDSDDEFEPESDWQAKIVWRNYHACTMSSTEWHFGGILVGTENEKLDFENLESGTLTADILPLPENFDFEDLSFYIYLLGHDSCADHKIKFAKKKSADIFDIEWTGKTALTYIGNYEFKREFTAFIENTKFNGFEFENGNADDFGKYIISPNLFEIRDNKIIIKQ